MMKKKIDKNYIVFSYRLMKIINKLRKYSSDVMISNCIRYSSNREFNLFLDQFDYCFNPYVEKLYRDLDLIVRNLLPYLDDDSIAQLCGVNLEVSQ